MTLMTSLLIGSGVVLVLLFGAVCWAGWAMRESMLPDEKETQWRD